MPKQYRLDSNIYQYVSQPDITDFTIVEVRDWVLECSDTYGNKDTARLFVARQIETLVDAGLLSVKRFGKKKKFFKTERFRQSALKVVTKRKRAQKEGTPSVSKNMSLLHELLSEKTNIEAELAITLAEVDEYKALMARSNDLTKLLNESYSETTQKAAALMAKLNVWTHTLSLIQREEPSPC
ncbi:hypothetical protein [Vibrio parahaemolyticus]|uniref:hypothetical protein n=1 Tax=Vibrio campbellii TaxID=680 RepID=UPI0023EB5E9D|nr:hypothetical protein [Vibrio parahaemolyticus]MDF5101795.1 hypothetical protein [Vibrio parahaemolyticus]MDF5258561.1 hypothetical protein [Vibrio parahaemolyticus]